jgi:hypothetical protein
LDKGSILVACRKFDQSSALEQRRYPDLAVQGNTEQSMKADEQTPSRDSGAVQVPNFDRTSGMQPKLSVLPWTAKSG